MDSQSKSKKKSPKRTKKISSTQKLPRKKSLIRMESSSTLLKKTQYGSTFHTVSSKVLIKKSTKKKKAKNTLKVKYKQISKTKCHPKNTKSKNQKILELTDRKKMHLEFFMYKNTYLPIENTQQRKFVYKINLVDERKSHVDKIFSRRDQQTITESIELVDATTDPEWDKENIECQTDLVESSSQLEQQREKNFRQFEQQSQKNFLNALSELQFLYLPDSKNFEGFSKNEKMHYRDLFIFLSKKFEEVNQSDEEIQTLLHLRECMQRGVTECILKKGIPTHTPSIISYLSNLFCYIDIHEKGPLIDRINCNYGYEMDQKLYRIRNGLSNIRHSKLLSESTFIHFEQQLHAEMQFESEVLEESLHYHNKAIFDCVNELLEFYQPYYNSRGEPFLWNYNFETTFYCISEDSFNALDSQIRQKVWQITTTLGGIIIETKSEEKKKPQIQKIIENQRMNLAKQAKLYDDKVEIDEARICLLMQVSDEIEFELLNNFCQFFHLLKQ